ATRLVIGAQYSYGEMSAANAVEVTGSQQKKKEKEKVPELISTQPVSVEKSIGIKAEIAGLIQDPMNSINSLKLHVSNVNQNPRINKFKDVLQSPNVDLATLARKRKEYEDSVSQAYARGVAGLDQTIWHQIHIDVPRTNPGIALYQYETTQQ
ncbi:9373_t:CDS:2, partial [Racocetra fulgida]